MVSIFFLLIYLLFFWYLYVANAIYIHRKMKIVTEMRENKSVRCAKILCEVFRTLYLTMDGLLVGFKFWVQNTHVSGYYEDLKKFPCKNYKYVSIFPVYCVIVVIRVLFVLSRLYQIRKIMNMGLSKRYIVLMAFLFSAMWAVVVLTETSDITVNGWFNGNSICWVNLPSYVQALWVVTITLFELLMLWLYIKPLLDIDLGNGGGFMDVLSYRSFQKDKTVPLLETYHGMSIRNIDVQTTAFSKHKLSSDAEMLFRYHQSVRRNFFSGVLSVLASLQYLIVYLIITPTPTGREYWYSGMGMIHFCMTFLIIYTCLTMSDRDWLHAFLPCARSQKSDKETDSSNKVPLIQHLSGGLDLRHKSDSDSDWISSEKMRESTLESIKSLMRSANSFEIKSSG